MLCLLNHRHLTTCRLSRRRLKAHCHSSRYRLTTHRLPRRRRLKMPRQPSSCLRLPRLLTTSPPTEVPTSGSPPAKLPPVLLATADRVLRPLSELPANSPHEEEAAASAAVADSLPGAVVATAFEKWQGWAAKEHRLHSAALEVRRRRLSTALPPPPAPRPARPASRVVGAPLLLPRVRR